MINLEIDGKNIAVESGTSVIEAANRLGIYVPHFCYHKKLSIAANCRMCLVQVEKAPKPLPACATPVAEGMKVQTASAQAVKAQKGVMEFLLINHPLDCPICDQGGECELQDLAVGYGGSASRYQEEKRMVMAKDIGPLVAAEEMSRCINCTRCVRFGIEIGGEMELGQAFRGEHAEIMSFLSGTVDSELSGNMIDLCPVGALTSKPFRYSARTWELSRRKSVSPHDGLGSNLTIQVKNNRVMRVLPGENEEINECWLSDKDRFSYDGLNSTDRLTKPMLKQDGQWIEVEWQTVLEYVANGLRQVKESSSAEHIAALATPHSTLEELYLLQKLVRGLGSNNVDFRLRLSDFSADGRQAGVPWLGMAVADINKCDRFLLVGSFLRKDQPLLATRVRHAIRKGAQLNVLHAADDDLLMAVANKSIVAPTDMVAVLTQILQAMTQIKQANPANSATSPASPAGKIAANLASGERVAILLGNFAQQHPQAVQLHSLSQQIAALCGGKFGFLGEAANSVGGYLAQAVPHLSANKTPVAKPGMNAASMLASPRKAYILLNVEADLDTHTPQQAMAAMRAADMVVALSAYKHNALDYADVLLPIAPFTETSGTFISTEGRVQSFKGVVQPLGEARPAWKILRVWGNLLEIPGFDQDSSEAVRDEALAGVDIASKLNNAGLSIAPARSTPVGAPLLHSDPSAAPVTAAIPQGDNVRPGLQRVSDVPIYAADAVVRRSAPLQATADAAEPLVMMHGEEFSKLGMKTGDQVKVSQGQGSIRLTARADNKLPKGVVRLAAGHAATAKLGAMFGTVTVERA